MKKLIFALIIGVFSSICSAQQTTLLCKGWAPIYKTFNSPPVNARSDNESFIIDLNVRSRTARYTTQIGEIVTQFEDKTNFYWGKSAVGKQYDSKFMRSVSLSLNRITGEALVMFNFEDDQDNRIVFSGVCAPSKPLF